MRRGALVVVVSLCLWATPALAAPSCKEQVAGAFTKQRGSRAFTMDSTLRGENGPVQIRVEYIPPDRMRQVINAPGQVPLETVLVGTRAWSSQGGAWEELMPALAQTIIAQVRAAVVDPPSDVGEFECLPNATVEGKSYLAYRSVEKNPASTAHRTVYVDPDTGLPAVNMVTEDKPPGETIFKGTYAYPTDLVIDGHPEAPLVRMR
jgi:hypothetical protein